MWWQSPPCYADSIRGCRHPLAGDYSRQDERHQESAIQLTTAVAMARRVVKSRAWAVAYRSLGSDSKLADVR